MSKNLYPTRYKVIPPNNYNSFYYTAAQCYRAGKGLNVLRDALGKIKEFESEEDALEALREFHKEHLSNVQNA